MPTIDSSRIDKFLWNVRLYKTRGQAAEACRKGQIIINAIPVKPSRIIREGETINLKKNPVLYSYKISAIPKSRLPAKLVPDFLEDITPEEELNKLLLRDTFFIVRDRGSGRPTKKERRLIDKIRGI